MNAQKYWQLVFSAAEGDPGKLADLISTGTSGELSGISLDKFGLDYARDVMTAAVAAINEVLDDGHDAQPS